MNNEERAESSMLSKCTLYFGVVIMKNEFRQLIQKGRQTTGSQCFISFFSSLPASAQK